MHGYNGVTISPRQRGLHCFSNDATLSPDERRGSFHPLILKRHITSTTGLLVEAVKKTAPSANRPSATSVVLGCTHQVAPETGIFSSFGLLIIISRLM
jgi:hypothetical protein